MERQSFAPDIILDRGEQGELQAIVAMPGFRVLTTLARGEVDRFILSLINADGADDAEVLARHKLAKAAAQFFSGLTGRINDELAQYSSAIPRKPIDITEGVLDFGEVATEDEDVLGEIV